MRDACFLGILLSVVLILGGARSARASDFVFEVPVNIAAVPEISLGVGPGINTVQVTCKVFSRGRQIASAKKQQRISGPYKGIVEVTVNVPDTAGKAESYSCVLELCTSIPPGAVSSCVDPGGRAPPGSVTQVRGAIR